MPLQFNCFFCGGWGEYFLLGLTQETNILSHVINLILDLTHIRYIFVGFRNVLGEI